MKKIGGLVYCFFVYCSLSFWGIEKPQKEEGEEKKEINVGGCSVLGNSLAWIIYIAPIAPPALLKIHSS